MISDSFKKCLPRDGNRQKKMIVISTPSTKLRVNSGRNLSEIYKHSYPINGMETKSFVLKLSLIQFLKFLQAAQLPLWLQMLAHNRPGNLADINIAARVDR